MYEATVVSFFQAHLKAPLDFHLIFVFQDFRYTNLECSEMSKTH